MVPDPAARAVAGPAPDDAVHHLWHGAVAHGPQRDPHSLVDVAVPDLAADETRGQEHRENKAGTDAEHHLDRFSDL